MRIVVVTSCTGEKAVADKRALTLRDFRKGKEHVKARESKLASLMTPAEELYTGQQHVRLMRGIDAFREKHPEKDSGTKLDLHIVSAGYGLVPGRRKLAPYEATFQGMKKGELRDWADELGVAAALRRVLRKPYDLALVLLGDSYLDACALDEAMRLGGPTLLFCGTRQAQKLPSVANLRAIPVSNPEATRFSCGLIALKGELASRLLTLVDQEPDVVHKIRDPATDVLARIDSENAVHAKPKRTAAVPNPNVDRVITLDPAWNRSRAGSRMSYFIPDWDDLVDPDYDFERDRHSGGKGNWNNEVYAHQLFDRPNYDGILLSRAVVDGNRRKSRLIASLGAHRMLRVPPEYPVMGDCGAFGYIKEETPPYDTLDVLDYYTRHGFDLGVSIDHLIVSGSEADQKRRFQLTVENAAEFIREHRKRSLEWTPIGAVQGWDVPSYVEGACANVAMGYEYIALGGLVRSRTPQILKIVAEVRASIPADVRLHVFGLGRPAALPDLVRLGVNSIDSASVLRQAWLGSQKNYLTKSGWYSAIRVPQTDASFRTKRLVADGVIGKPELERLESRCLAGLRAFDRTSGPVPTDLISSLVEYDVLVAAGKRDSAENIRRTLEDRPWKHCGCSICEASGVEVAVFRGNNRNRRRGFHNTGVFYELLGEVLRGEEQPWIAGLRSGEQDQLGLFAPRKNSPV